ncbi:UpxY family transcription antiterminator [Rhodohalobacter sp. WB101]|uniref:UpxY family transcription antiterminator n=2 Tax=Rhodohalobacter sulfatireducens TaxID=2911366 RepID=A0ABS9KIV5_9BACT|nr:UpxY family transcription antiterminator [Rhodohalobacter sulfatireducens]
MKEPTRNWYAFYLKPRHEKKASARLEEQYDFEIFCPLKEERVRWSDRWKTVTKPYIPGYLFACVTEKERRIVLEDRSVFRTVCWKGRPAVIREEEIETVKRITGHPDVEDIRLEQISPGDRVSIDSGEFRELNGIVVNVKGNRASVRLESLHSNMTFTVKRSVLNLVS